MVAYVAALVVTIVTWGVPSDRIYQAAWLVAGIIAFRIDRPWRAHLRVIADWAPLIAALVVYDLTRGIAAELGMPVQVEAPAAVERWLFDGTIPTVWLQQHLLPSSGQPPWWTVFTGIVYSTHFVVPWVLGAVFYVRSRAVWAKYMRRVLVLSYLGLVTYVLLPAAPPWYASAGAVIIEPVRRVAGFGFGVVPLDTSTVWLSAHSNPVAAMPSLHAAFSLLVLISVWPYVRYRWARMALVLYPLAMAFTLIYGGEHYFIDIAMGWVYTLIAILVCRWWEGRRRDPDVIEEPTERVVVQAGTPVAS
nr:phosphatase PAP2 family protein [Skermania sp. ID1734]